MEHLNLTSGPEPRKPKNTGELLPGFSVQEAKHMQALRDILRDAGIGRKPEDLPPQGGTAVEVDPSTILDGSAPKSRLERIAGDVFAGNVGPLTDEDMSKIMNTRAPWENEPVERSDIASSVGQPTTSAELAPIDQSLSEQTEGASKDAPENDPRAFANWVHENYSPEAVQLIMDKFGELEATYLLLQEYLGVDIEAPRPEGTFVHASTGELVDKQGVIDQIEKPISPDDLSRFYDELYDYLDTETSVVDSGVVKEMRKSIQEIIDAAENGDIAKDEGDESPTR